jgi:chemotaxis protein methyltransferase CheR
MKAGIFNTNSTGLWDLISARLGLEFPKVRRNTVLGNLASAIGEFGFDDFNTFIAWLLSTELKKEEIEKLASYLTITETFFWREPHVFSALTDFILPGLVKMKKDGDRTIRIWSAGCSTGEEPYSLAIAIEKSIPDLKNWNIKILATDINPKALKKAATGIYTKWSFRNCPSWLQTSYFINLGKEGYEIVPKIKEMVTFRNLNLTDDVFPSFTNDTHSMDIIFCRNVLMYFSDEWVSRISRNLYKSLNKDSWFVVASCELSSYVFPQFKPVNFQDAILYCKGDEPKITFGGSQFVSVPKETEVKVNEQPEPWLISVIKGENNPFMVNESFEHHVLVDVADNEAVLESIPELNQVVDVISEVSRLANKGNLQDALSLCNEGIGRDKLDIGLYSLRASILQELDRHDDAIESLKQAIYLDPDFIMGHFALGNLYVRQNKKRNARMHFKNVLDLISNLENDDIIPESDGLSVKYINDIIKLNFQNQKMI